MQQKPKVFLGSDHAGFDLKEWIKEWIIQNEFGFEDGGCFSQKSCDYPYFAFKVCKGITIRPDRKAVGILICGTGIGMSVAANKIEGITAALCSTHLMAQRAREHNNANVLCLGADVVSKMCVLDLVDTFLFTPFSREKRHKRRNRIIREKGPEVNREIEGKKSKLRLPTS